MSTTPEELVSLADGTADASAKDPVRDARSLLFVPGDRPDRFDKAVGSGADLAVLDLEDAVAPEERPAARDAVTAWLAEGGRATVRISALGSDDAKADIAALRAQPPLAVVAAKAEDPEALAELAATLGVPVIALIETARGIHEAARIAAAQGVARLALGHLDLAADLGCRPVRSAILPHRSALVLASRLAELPGPIDGVTAALDDIEELSEDIAHAHDLGMTGKLLIHPRQVEPVHEALRPTEAEVSWAHRVVTAVLENGPGAARVDGEMVDPPVLARAETILRRKDSA